MPRCMSGALGKVSYVDIYWLLAVISVLMSLLCFFLAKNQPGKTGMLQFTDVSDGLNYDVCL